MYETRTCKIKKFYFDLLGTRVIVSISHVEHDGFLIFSRY